MATQSTWGLTFRPVFTFYCVCVCEVDQFNKYIMASLTNRDIERAKFTFDIYDFEGNATMDAFYIGDALRALNLNPTNAQCEALGALKQKKQKYLKIDDFLPIYEKQKKEKDTGCYDDYIEVLRLYDKNDDGMLPFAELRHVLLAIGERFEDAKDLDPFLAETFTEEEDEDGFVPYAPFAKRLVAGPYPDTPATE